MPCPGPAQRCDTLIDFRNDLPQSDFMKRRIRSAVLFSIAAILTAMGISYLFTLGPKPPPTQILTYVGDFPGDLIWLNTSAPLSVYEQLQNHIIVIFFSRFSNLADVEYLNRLEELNLSYPDNPLAIVVVLEDEQSDPGELMRTVETWGVFFPVIVDATGEVSSSFGVSSTPALVVLDTKARVSARFYSGWEQADLKGIVGDLLEQGTATRSLAVTRFTPDGGSFFPDSIQSEP
jgi:hypothetical protein